MAYNAEVLELLDDLDSNYSDDDFDGYIDDEDEEVQERRRVIQTELAWTGIQQVRVMVMKLTVRVRVRVMELRERVKAETRDMERMKIHKVMVIMVNREVRRTTMDRQVAEMEVALLESCLT